MNKKNKDQEDFDDYNEIHSHIEHMDPLAREKEKEIWEKDMKTVEASRQHKQEKDS